MQHNQGVPASPSGYSAEPEPSCTVSAVPVSIPNAVQELRENADALHKWFKSMDEQRRDWTYPHGVESTARDALEGVYRIAASVVAGLKQAASAIEAFGQDGETRLDAKHESAVAKPDAQPTPVSDPISNKGER